MPIIDPHDALRPNPMEHPRDSKMTLAEKRKFEQAKESIMRLHMHVYGREMQSLHIPEEWQRLTEGYRPQPKKVRITLLLDEDVAKFYRSYGKGYGAFVNDVLKSYAQLRVSKMLEASVERGPRGEAL